MQSTTFYTLRQNFPGSTSSVDIPANKVLPKPNLQYITLVQCLGFCSVDFIILNLFPNKCLIPNENLFFKDRLITTQKLRSSLEKLFLEITKNQFNIKLKRIKYPVPKISRPIAEYTSGPTMTISKIL